MNTSRILAGLAVVGGLVWGAGCSTSRVAVRQAPPPPVVENVPISPGPAYVWINGHHVWRNEWVWIPGHWAVPPYPKAIWVRGRWTRRGPGWEYIPGHWQRF